MHTLLNYCVCRDLVRLYVYKLCYKRYSVFSKSVFISDSDDVYSNLAIEDWFYNKCDFQDRQVLFLWKNSRCIVIGRHQNPWLESNTLFFNADEIQLVRRNSGGGAVYHDYGNLNITFFTSRKYYNRKKNLGIITKVLRDEWQISASINDKDDILYENNKISGSAAKLGSHNTYHHCTLLVDTNKSMMSGLLHKSDKGIMTNATASRPSKVINLREINNIINIDRLMTVIGLEYLRTSPNLCNIENQDNVKQDGFHIISPNEQFFPGLNDKISELKSWKWIFGRTPKFKVTRRYNFETLNRIIPDYTFSVNAVVDVDHGIVTKISLEFPVSFLTFLTSNVEKKITRSFIYQPFSENIFELLFARIDTELLSTFNDERIISIL